MSQTLHHWVKIYTNPLAKAPGWISFNLYDVHSISAIQPAGEDKPILLQIATEAAQFNLDGCGRDQFLAAWEAFQTATHEDAGELMAEPFTRVYRFEGTPPEAGLIRPAMASDLPS